MEVRRSRGQIFLKTFAKCLALLIWTGGILILAQFLLAFPFRGLANLFHSDNTTLLQALYSVTTYLVSFVIIVFIPKLCKQRYQKSHKGLKGQSSIRQILGLIGLPTWTDIGLAVVAYVVFTVIAGIVAGIFSALFPWFDIGETQNVGFSNLVFGPDRLLAFFILVIVAPIVEELIFRGFLYSKLKIILSRAKSQRKKPQKNQKLVQVATSEPFTIIIATLLTSLLFALVHGQWNVGVNVFVMSVALCLLREITGTTYAGILTHMLKNLIAFFILFVFTSGL